VVNKDEILKLLRCPRTGAALSWVNGFEALQAEDHDIFYPVIDNIFYLLGDYSSATQEQVQKFYNDVGWKQTEGVYQDALDSEDLRSISADYILQCHLRLNQFLPKQGKYLLDIACGPVQYAAYETYSKNFEYRICADISVRALMEAQKKLGDQGIYVLCDITQLPFRSDQIDAAISLHTLYHVEQKKQLQAFDELNRVLKPQGTSVVVYSWGRHSLLMALFLFPQKILNFSKRFFLRARNGDTLYFYAHSYQWFDQHIKAKYASTLYAWRSVNVPFLKLFVHPWLAGRAVLKAIFWLENRFPIVMGRIGAYPLFVTTKGENK
jgi:ubiquinone/menaquinone biosynthesis C-methylase UbiE